MVKKKKKEYKTYTIHIPIELGEPEYKALTLAAEDKKKTIEEIYLDIINECEALSTDELFDTTYEILDPYGYGKFLEEDE